MEKTEKKIDQNKNAEKEDKKKADKKKEKKNDEKMMKVNEEKKKVKTKEEKKKEIKKTKIRMKQKLNRKDQEIQEEGARGELYLSVMSSLVAQLHVPLIAKCLEHEVSRVAAIPGMTWHGLDHAYPNQDLPPHTADTQV